LMKKMLLGGCIAINSDVDRHLTVWSCGLRR
jgi:hypothetical protein